MKKGRADLLGADVKRFEAKHPDLSVLVEPLRQLKADYVEFLIQSGADVSRLLKIGKVPSNNLDGKPRASGLCGILGREEAQ